MAVLTTLQRQALRKTYSDKLSSRRELLGLSRPELDLAIADTDAYIDANAAAYNTALSASIRTKLTAAQKAELFSLVAMIRFSG